MIMYSEEAELPRKGVQRDIMEEINIEMSNHVYCCNDLDLIAI
jgi:hypothetical protein